MPRLLHTAAIMLHNSEKYSTRAFWKKNLCFKILEWGYFWYWIDLKGDLSRACLGFCIQLQLCCIMSHQGISRAGGFRRQRSWPGRGVCEFWLMWHFFAELRQWFSLATCRFCVNEDQRERDNCLNYQRFLGWRCKMLSGCLDTWLIVRRKE